MLLLQLVEHEEVGLVVVHIHVAALCCDRLRVVREEDRLPEHDSRAPATGRPRIVLTDGSGGGRLPRMALEDHQVVQQDLDLGRTLRLVSPNPQRHITKPAKAACHENRFRLAIRCAIDLCTTCADHYLDDVLGSWIRSCR
eukprot:7108048-Pyramimonas_sp.AAC.3